MIQPLILPEIGKMIFNIQMMNTCFTQCMTIFVFSGPLMAVIVTDQSLVRQLLTISSLVYSQKKGTKTVPMQVPILFHVFSGT